MAVLLPAMTAARFLSVTMAAGLLAAVNLCPLHGGSVAFLESRVAADPDDFVAWNLLGERYLRELRETGADRYLRKAAEAAERSREAMPARENPGGVALSARAALAGHRFAEARAWAEELARLQPRKLEARFLLVDALLELGDYKRASEVLAQMADDDPDPVELRWRAARLNIVHGQLSSAREHLCAGLEAAQKLGVAAAGVVAWYHVQLGAMDFRCGDFGAAKAQYQAALAVNSEDAAALDHLAELHAADGKTTDAIAILERLVSRSPRAFWMQALGDVLAHAGERERARSWHERALAIYNASIDRGEVHYHHQLAAYYTDVVNEPAQAEAHARKDLELRQSISAWDALAWAHYKMGEVEQARDTMAHALETGTADPHILHHAGVIYMSAGDFAGGRMAMGRAAEVNPRYLSFHFHR